MTGEREAFLRTICESPEDDAPRLVFADWLEERGEEARAEFIRLHIRLAGMLPEDPDAEPLHRRARDLLELHGETWWIPGLPAEQQRFWRGFVEWVELPAAEFLVGGGTLFARTPLQVVRLRSIDGMMPDVARSPLLARLRGLEIQTQGIGNDGVAILAGSPHLGGLRELDLHSNNITAQGVEALAGAAGLTGLRRLVLSENPVGDDGAGHLALAERLRTLRELSLRRRRLYSSTIPYIDAVHAAGAAYLAGSPYLWRLERLNLAGQCIGDGGFRSIVTSPTTRSLRVLDVSGNDIGAIGTSGVEALTTTENLPSLVALSLSENAIGSPGARELARWPGLSRLVQLDLSGCHIGASGAHGLAESPYLNPKTELILTDNPIPRRELDALRGRLSERLRV